MITKKNLGVYSGQNYISLAEVVNKKLVHHFSSPHSLADFDPNNKAIPDEIKLTAVLQRSLRDKKIDSTSVHLCIRTKDIILRSFFIPFMMPNEVKGVVEFEINRYIPFKLEELAYNYHSTILKENKAKRIRILFVAVRKDLLDKYCAMLEDANLKVVTIEPEPLSLIRLLTFKKYILPQQTIAVIQMDQREGAIIMVDNGIPQFVREFRLAMPTQTQMEVVEREVIKTRLFSEVRISLDYYARQHANSIVDKVLFFSSSPSPEIAEKLGQDLGLTTTALTPKSILGVEEDLPLGMLNAFGAGLRNNVAFPVNIDLAKPRVRETPGEFKIQPLNFVRIAQVGAVCAAMLLMCFLISNHLLATKESKLSNLTQRQGPFASLSIEELEHKREETLKKIEAYKNVVLKSNVAFFLQRIPELLPKGAWLNNLSIIYADEGAGSTPDRKKTDKTVSQSPGNRKVTIMMDGYIYAPDVGEQISLANRLPSALKSDQNFFRFFQDAKLLSVRKENLEDYSITYFQISLK